MNFIVNGFFGGVKFWSNLSVVRASGNRKLEFQSKIWNSAHRWFVQGLRMSILKTFGTGFDIYEVGRIDILGAGGTRPGFFFFLVFVDTDYSEARLNTSDFSLSGRLKLSRINLAWGAEQLRDRCFFCVWRGWRRFCEFPAGLGLWGFRWGRYKETGVWR